MLSNSQLTVSIRHSMAPENLDKLIRENYLNQFISEKGEFVLSNRKHVEYLKISNELKNFGFEVKSIFVEVCTNFRTSILKKCV
jgi:hypothetical protein